MCRDRVGACQGREVHHVHYLHPARQRAPQGSSRRRKRPPADPLSSCSGRMAKVLVRHRPTRPGPRRGGMRSGARPRTRPADRGPRYRHSAPIRGDRKPGVATGREGAHARVRKAGDSSYEHRATTTRHRPEHEHEHAGGRTGAAAAARRASRAGAAPGRQRAPGRGRPERPADPRAGHRAGAEGVPREVVGVAGASPAPPCPAGQTPRSALSERHPGATQGATRSATQGATEGATQGATSFGAQQVVAYDGRRPFSGRASWAGRGASRDPGARPGPYGPPAATVAGSWDFRDRTIAREIQDHLACVSGSPPSWEEEATCPRGDPSAGGLFAHAGPELGPPRRPRHRPWETALTESGRSGIRHTGFRRAGRRPAETAVCPCGPCWSPRTSNHTRTPKNGPEAASCEAG